MKMGQLFVNSFTLRYWSLKLSLSLHKQIKSAAFEGQDRYCIISSDWCIISSVGTVHNTKPFSVRKFGRHLGRKRFLTCARATTALRRSRNLTKTITRFLPIGLLPIAHLPSDFYLSDICQSRLLPIRHFPIKAFAYFQYSKENKTFAYFQYSKENKTFAYQTFTNHVLIPLSVTFANQ